MRLWHQSGGKGRFYRGHPKLIDRTIWKNVDSFIYAVHCDHCAISDHSAAICHRMSATLKSTGVFSLGQNFGVLSVEQIGDVEVYRRLYSLENHEIFLKNSNLCYHDTSTLRTDGQTTCLSSRRNRLLLFFNFFHLFYCKKNVAKLSNRKPFWLAMHHLLIFTNLLPWFFCFFDHTE